MIKLLLVHHSRLTCELFTAALREEPDIQIVGYAQNRQEAVAYAKQPQYNTALVDVALPQSDALSLAKKLGQAEQDAKVLLMGLVNSTAAILHCIEEGIDGYVLEEESLADLAKKLRAVHDNEFIITPDIAAALMERVADLKSMTRKLYGISLNWADDLAAELTPREWEVLQLIAEKQSNQQIANELVITTGTVKNHVHSILSKLDVNSREQAALLMHQLMTKPQVKGQPALAPQREAPMVRSSGAREDAKRAHHLSDSRHERRGYEAGKTQAYA